jgi:hypothetical protein
MAAPTLTYDDLIKFKPCSDRLSVAIKRIGTAQEWSGNGITAQQARDAGMHFSDIVWVASAASRNDADVARRLCLWAADCAARVLHVYERSETSCAPRNAIVASRAYSRGEIDKAARDAASAAAGAAARAAARGAAWAAARDAAWAAAWAAAGDAARAAANAANAAARDAAGAAARDAAWAAAWAAAGDAARAAAWAAAWAAAGDAARAAEEQWQFDRLILWFSDNEPDDWPLPEVPAKEAA